MKYCEKIRLKLFYMIAFLISLNFCFGLPQKKYSAALLYSGAIKNAQFKEMLEQIGIDVDLISFDENDKNFILKKHEVYDTYKHYDVFLNIRCQGTKNMIFDYLVNQDETLSYQSPDLNKITSDNPGMINCLNFLKEFKTGKAFFIVLDSYLPDSESVDQSSQNLYNSIHNYKQSEKYNQRYNDNQLYKNKLRWRDLFKNRALEHFSEKFEIIEYQNGISKNFFEISYDAIMYLNKEFKEDFIQRLKKFLPELPALESIPEVLNPDPLPDYIIQDRLKNDRFKVTNIEQKPSTSPFDHLQSLLVMLKKKLIDLLHVVNSFVNQNRVENYYSSSKKILQETKKMLDRLQQEDQRKQNFQKQQKENERLEQKKREEEKQRREHGQQEKERLDRQKREEEKIQEQKPIKKSRKKYSVALVYTGGIHCSAITDLLEQCGVEIDVMSFNSKDQNFVLKKHDNYNKYQEYDLFLNIYCPGSRAMPLGYLFHQDIALKNYSPELRTICSDNPGIINCLNFLDTFKSKNSFFVLLDNYNEASASVDQLSEILKSDISSFKNTKFYQENAFSKYQNGIEYQKMFKNDIINDFSKKVKILRYVHLQTGTYRKAFFEKKYVSGKGDTLILDDTFKKDFIERIGKILPEITNTSYISPTLSFSMGQYPNPSKNKNPYQRPLQSIEQNKERSLEQVLHENKEKEQKIEEQKQREIEYKKQEQKKERKEQERQEKIKLEELQKKYERSEQKKLEKKEEKRLNDTNRNQTSVLLQRAPKFNEHIAFNIFLENSRVLNNLPPLMCEYSQVEEYKLSNKKKMIAAGNLKEITTTEDGRIIAGPQFDYKLADLILTLSINRNKLHWDEIGACVDLYHTKATNIPQLIIKGMRLERYKDEEYVKKAFLDREIPATTLLNQRRQVFKGYGSVFWFDVDIDDNIILQNEDNIDEMQQLMIFIKYLVSERRDKDKDDAINFFMKKYSDEKKISDSIKAGRKKMILLRMAYIDLARVKIKDEKIYNAIKELQQAKEKEAKNEILDFNIKMEKETIKKNSSHQFNQKPQKELPPSTGNGISKQIDDLLNEF